MQTWQMQTAKARFSDLVQRAKQDGPQEITVHGRSVAVVVSPELFERLSGAHESLADFLNKSPLCGLEELEIERDRSPGREITL